MKSIGLFVVVTLASSFVCAGMPGSGLEPASSDTLQLIHADSTEHAHVRRLLPENMSFVEKGLWGENGLVRNIGIASPLTPEVRKNELDVRRTMLSMHQVGGFVTLGLLATTVYFGQRVLDGHRDLLPTHKAFVAATISSYSLTALLSVLSPPPLIRRDEFSTTTLHKTLAWIHAAGMIVTPILGAMIRHRNESDMRRAHFHQISAYITTATLAAAMVTVTF